MKWWGYVHENGSLQIKRYFDEQDIRDAEESPFVRSVHDAFEAENREEAERFLIAELAKKALQST